VMVMKAEMIRTGEGTVMVISQRSPNGTDENNNVITKMFKVNVISNWVLRSYHSNDLRTPLMFCIV
jgi:hypothetical protein